MRIDRETVAESLTADDGRLKTCRPQATMRAPDGEKRNKQRAIGQTDPSSHLANCAETATLAAIEIVAEIGLARSKLALTSAFPCKPVGSVSLRQPSLSLSSG